MDALLYQRLDILLEAGEINEEVKEATIGFAQAVEEKYRLEMTEGNASMLITHFAMALARILRGEAVEGVEEALLTEVKEEKAYYELPPLYRAIEEKLQLIIPDSEKDYITLHACALISGTKK